MIRFLLGVIVFLALVGGAIQLKATDKEWSLVVNKEAALNSVKNGAVIIYDLSNQFADKFKKTGKSEEALPKKPTVER